MAINGIDAAKPIALTSHPNDRIQRL